MPIELTNLLEGDATGGASRPLGGADRVLAGIPERLKALLAKLKAQAIEGEPGNGDPPPATPHEAEGTGAKPTSDAPTPAPVSGFGESRLVPLERLLEGVWGVTLTTEPWWPESRIRELVEEAYGDFDELIYRHGAARMEEGRTLVVEVWEVLQGEERFWLQARGDQDDVIELEPRDKLDTPEVLYSDLDGAVPGWAGDQKKETA